MTADVILIGLNTRHTHCSLSLALLQAFWEKDPSNPRIERIDFDLNQGNDSIIQNIVLKKPRLLGFSVYIWNLISAAAISGSVKAALPDVKIIFGGPEVSFDSERIFSLAPWVDLIVNGEGEETFSEILSSFFADKSMFDGIAGTSVFRNGQLIQNPQRKLISDLDSLPSAFSAGYYGTGKGFTYYEASRGCPFKCAYCLSSVLGPVRNFSLQRVKDDLDWFFQSDYSQVRFADRTFNLDNQRAENIVKYILEKNYKKICFHFELKPEILTDSFIELLGHADPGLFHLEIGVQSTNPESLEAVSRKSDPQKLAERIQCLRDRTKCHVHLDLLAGLPGENFELFKKTLNDAHSWKVSTIQVGLVKVLKGTALENSVRDGSLSVAPFPPYSVQRSKWLTSEEIIRIQDIGKLVEGIGNSERYNLSLNFICNFLFKSDWAEFYDSLAFFWRKTGKQFFALSPENIKKALSEHLSEVSKDSDITCAADSLLTHELRLIQKVPAGKAGPVPIVPNLSGRPLVKKTNGYKTFWYNVDVQELIECNKIAILPSPVVYHYQTDLSLPPDSSMYFLPIEDRFLMALADQVDTVDTICEIWNQQKRASRSSDFFLNSLDKLIEKGLLSKR
ncbi:MAG: DUF4080 domain-containing protein [Candidatus Riflebacteria bacterium]|nr:DUF4080 domain-containing protein [Candidatus Riflebacteria bacterium]